MRVSPSLPSPTLRQLNYTGLGYGEKTEEVVEEEEEEEEVEKILASLDICSTPFAKLEIYSSARERWQSLLGSKGDAAQW